MEEPEAQAAALQLFGGKLFVVHLAVPSVSAGFTARLRKLVLKSIFANGGHIIGTDDAYVEGADYVIATHEQQALVQQTREAQAAGAAACVFGPQWVLACVDEGQLVEANDAFGLLAAPPEVGIPGFRENCGCIHVSGIPSDIKNLKLLLQYWVEGMGGRVETEAVGAHVSHVVTWQEGALLPRHLAMLSRFPHIRFVNYRWVMACHDSKALISEEPFLLQLPDAGAGTQSGTHAGTQAGAREDTPGEQQQAPQGQSPQKQSPQEREPKAPDGAQHQTGAPQLQQEPQPQDLPGPQHQEPQAQDLPSPQPRQPQQHGLDVQHDAAGSQHQSQEQPAEEPPPPPPQLLQDANTYEQQGGEQGQVDGSRLVESLAGPPAFAPAVGVKQEAECAAQQMGPAPELRAPQQLQPQLIGQQELLTGAAAGQQLPVQPMGGCREAGERAAGGAYQLPVVQEEQLAAGAQKAGVPPHEAPAPDMDMDTALPLVSQHQEHQQAPELHPHQGQHDRQQSGTAAGGAKATEAEAEAAACAMWVKPEAADAGPVGVVGAEGNIGHDGSRRAPPQPLLQPCAHLAEPQEQPLPEAEPGAPREEQAQAGLDDAPGLEQPSNHEETHRMLWRRRRQHGLGVQPGQQPEPRRRRQPKAWRPHGEEAQREAELGAPQLPAPEPQAALEGEEAQQACGQEVELQLAGAQEDEVQPLHQPVEQRLPDAGGEANLVQAPVMVNEASCDAAGHAPAGPDDAHQAVMAAVRVKPEPEDLVVGAGAGAGAGAAGVGPMSLGFVGAEGVADVEAGQGRTEADAVGAGALPPASAPVPYSVGFHGTASSEEPSQQAVLRAHRRVAAMLPALIGSATESADETTPGGGAAAGPLMLRCMAGFEAGVGVGFGGGAGAEQQCADGGAVEGARGGCDGVDAEAVAGPEGEMNAGALPLPTTAAAGMLMGAPPAAAQRTAAVGEDATVGPVEEAEGAEAEVQDEQKLQPPAANGHAAGAGGKKQAAKPRQRKAVKDAGANVAVEAEVEKQEQRQHQCHRSAGSDAAPEPPQVPADAEAGAAATAAPADVPKAPKRRKRQGADGDKGSKAAIAEAQCAEPCATAGAPAPPEPVPELRATAAAAPAAAEAADCQDAQPLRAQPAAPAKGAKRKAKAAAAAAAVSVFEDDMGVAVPPPSAGEYVRSGETAPEAGPTGDGVAAGVADGRAGGGVHGGMTGAAAGLQNKPQPPQARAAKGTKRKARAVPSAAAPASAVAAAQQETGDASPAPVPAPTPATVAKPAADPAPAGLRAGGEGAAAVADSGGGAGVDGHGARDGTMGAPEEAKAQQPKAKRRRAAAPKLEEGVAAARELEAWPEARPKAVPDLETEAEPEAKPEAAAADVGVEAMEVEVAVAAGAGGKARARSKAGASKKAKADAAAAAAAAVTQTAAADADGCRAGTAAPPPGPTQSANGSDGKGAAAAISSKRAGGKRSAGEAGISPTVSPAAKADAGTSEAGVGAGAGSLCELTFALSGFSRSEDRTKYGNLLTKLGLTYVGANGWDPRITALLAPSLKRSDKTVCAMAAGAWLLTTDYLTALQRNQQAGAGGGGAGGAGGGGGGGAGGMDLQSYEHSKCEDGPGIISEGAPAHWRMRCVARGCGAGARAFAGMSLLVPEGLAKPLVASLQAAGVPVVDCKYVVEWVAHPHKPLAAHFRHGTSPGPALAQMERQRGQVQPPGGGSACAAARRLQQSGPIEQVDFQWTASAPNGVSLAPLADGTATTANPFPLWNGIGQGETAVQAGPSAYTFTQNPHKATFAPSPATRLNAPSTLDHVKHLQLRQATRTRDDAKTVLSITMASQTFLPATIPYTIYGNREDDIRLGSCAVNFIDFEKMLVADMFLTNTGVWALYERLPFARSETNIYAAFTFVKRVKYIRSANIMEWWVDGELKLTLGRIGYKPPSALGMVAGLDLGGFGCYALVDFADPTGRGREGFLNLNPTASGQQKDEVYFVPKTFQVDTRKNVSAISDPSWRLFGQGTSMSVSAIKVAYELSA
eukprot:XP_001697439.1 predicted protein [Chlamydomonas reinhardtii]